MAQNEAQHLPGSSAEGHANADFVCLKRDEVRHHAIDTNQSQNKTASSERAEKKGLRTRGSVDLSDALIERCDRGDGLVAIDRPDAFLKRGNERKGIGTRAGDYIYTEDPRCLEKGSVDLRFRGILRIGFARGLPA